MVGSIFYTKTVRCLWKEVIRVDQAKVGKYIAQLRKAKKLTQIELAEKLSLTDKAVSKWECGLGCPDISLLIPLSEILETSIYELLIGESMNKVPVEKVDEALKTTINVATNEKKKNLIYRIILIISVVMILLELVFIGLLYFDKYREDNEYRNPLPEKMKISIVNDYLLKLKKYSCNIDLDNQWCNNGNNDFNPVTILAYKLPMHRFKVLEGQFYPYPDKEKPPIEYDFDQVLYDYNSHTEEEINNDFADDNYTKKSMIVNSIILFNYVENLESINYVFKNKTYLINKENVERIYKDQYVKISTLKQESNWKKYVIDKLKDDNYVNSILDSIVEKY